MFDSRKTTRWALMAALSALVSGCDKEERQPTEDRQEEDAGAVDRTAQLDPSLAKAVAAASAKAPSPQAAAEGGPPPKGIFGPGEADRQIKKGAPALLTLGSEGEAPRYPLGASKFRAGDKVKGTVQVAVQTDPRQGALPVDFNLSFEAKSAPGAPEMTHVVAKVDSASVGAMGLPAELLTALNQLKGSRVEYQIAANGAGANFTTIMAKGAENNPLAHTLRSLSDALATITLPYPDKPLGTGAFWMATSREGVMGLDLVTYRLIRVQRAEPTQVTLTIETKRYATGTDFDLVGLPGKYALEEFQSTADGTAMIALGQPLPYKGLLKLNLGAVLIPEQNPQEQGTLQVQGQARFTFDSLQDPAGQGVQGTTTPAPGQSQPPSAPPPAPAPGPASAQ